MTQELQQKIQELAKLICSNECKKIGYEIEENDLQIFMQFFQLGAAAMLAELAPLVEWVDVNERLPENQEQYIVKLKCRRKITKYSINPEKPEFTMYSLGNYRDGKWYILHTLIENKFHCESFEITHWKEIEL